MNTRREFVVGGLAAISAPIVGCKSYAEEIYPGWKYGELDIHFIHTGVGEQTFFIFPDGTTMLLDCGDTHHAKYMKEVPPMPNDSRYGGEWVSRYIQRVHKSKIIDYAMISHWHGDHTGDLMFGGKRLSDGRVLCGLPLVGEDFAFSHYYDHQYPLMGQYGKDPDPDALKLMKSWLPLACKKGMKPHRFEVGALNQIALLKSPMEFSNFEIRNIAGNGMIWDGNEGVIDVARTHIEMTGNDSIHENRLSAAFRLKYGKFSYFTGGDNELTMIGKDGKEFNWEAMIGRVVGKVNVCKTNHHAGTAGMSADFVKEVCPQVYLSSVWQARMVDHKSLMSMCSRELYAGERMVCFGYIADSRKEVASKYGDDIAPAGHAVVKVSPKGDRFKVFVLSAEDETMRIVATREFECN